MMVLVKLLSDGCTDNGSEVSGSGQVNDLDGDGLSAFNYNPLANTDDESCITIVNGCIDNGSEISGSGQVNDLDGDGLSAFNYNPLQILMMVLVLQL